MKKYYFLIIPIFLILLINNKSYSDNLLFDGQLNLATGVSTDKKNASNISLSGIAFFYPLYFEFSNSYCYMGKRENIELHFYHFSLDFGFNFIDTFGFKFGTYISVPLKNNISSSKVFFGLEAGVDFFIFRSANKKYATCKVGLLTKFDLIKTVNSKINNAYYLNLGIFFNSN